MKSHIYKKKTIDRLLIKSNYLGKNYNVILLLNIRIILCILLFSVVALFTELGLVLAPCLVIIFYYLLEYLFFDIRITKRKYDLETEAIQFFELLIIALKSKRSIISSLEVVTHNLDNDLAKEFQKVLKDVNIGRNFNEAIDNMKKRIPSDSINSILLSIEEANGNESIIIDSLRIQIDHLREKMIQDIKCDINVMPVKMNIISFSFIVILFCLVIYMIKLLEIF